MPDRSEQFDGRGPLGCGCAFLVAGGFALKWLVRLGTEGVLASIAIGLLAGIVAWRLGDDFLENLIRRR